MQLKRDTKTPSSESRPKSSEQGGRSSLRVGTAKHPMNDGDAPRTSRPNCRCRRDVDAPDSKRRSATGRGQTRKGFQPETGLARALYRADRHVVG